MTFCSVQVAQELLKAKEAVALPTETVYGLAANAYIDSAVQTIFALKKRPSSNPLIVHYLASARLQTDVVWTPLAEQLAQHFWPGPLTLVLERAPETHLSPLVSAGLTTVAVRVPAHPLFREVLEGLPFPLAAPSANPSGALTPTQESHVRRLLPEVPCVAGGPTLCGLESTVLDARGERPVVLREGALSREAVSVKLALSLREPQSGHFHSPGMFPRHYSPSKALRLNANSVQEGEGLLAFGPHPVAGASVTLNLSVLEDLEEAAANLFAYLHQLDQTACHRIAVMPIPKHGLGAAINDRLQRASSP